MSVKMCLILCIALAAFTHSSWGESLNEFETKNLIEDFKKVIEHLKETIRETISVASGRLKKILADVLEFAKKELAKAIEDVKEHMGMIVADLKQLEEKAQLLGLDIKECLEESKTNFDQLAENTIKDLHKCIDNRVIEAKSIFDRAITLFAKSYESVLSLTIEFDHCTDNLCRIQVIQKVLKTIFNVASEVRIIFNESVEFLQIAIPEISKCITERLVTMHHEAQDITRNIQVCINNKIENQ